MYEKFVKRILDVVISLVAMPFVLIICAVLVPIIKHEDKGPAFYNAPRVGKDGVEFKMYKFRSMYVNAPDLKMPDGSTYNGPDDPRMTKIGAFMRRTSLDEVPQFFNVLIGNMSLIGPRPDVWDEVELYEGNDSDKLKVKPGITGYAQVYGRNSIPWRQRLKLDVYYVEHVSFALDVKIFFKTIVNIIKEEGIYNEPEEDGDDGEGAGPGDGAAAGAGAGTEAGATAGAETVAQAVPADAQAAASAVSQCSPQTGPAGDAADAE